MNRYNIQVVKKRTFKSNVWVAIDRDIIDYKTITIMGKHKRKKDCLQAVEQHKKLINRILNN